MNQKTANNMINALQPYRQYLLINEWKNICGVINHYVEGLKATNFQQPKKEELPPLKELWNYLWNKKVKLSYTVIIIIFGIGLLIGSYI